MRKTRIRFVITLAILFAVFSAIAFVVPFLRNGVFWVAYGFGAFALVAQLFTLSSAFGRESPRSRFYGFPIAKLSVLYLFVQLVVSLVLLIVARWIAGWVAALICVFILAVAALGFIAADATRAEIERQDSVHKARVNTMHALQSKSVFIASQCDDSETKKALNKLAESFRYSDPVSSDALEDIEATLTALVDELQSAVLEKDYAAAQTLCSRADAALADRNRLCRLNK